MSVSSATSSSNPCTLQGLYQQHKNDFKTLISDVQSGGLNGAQAALTALQQTQAVGGATATGSAQSSFSQNLVSLIQAVQSGDLAGAQEDVTQLQSEMNSQAGGHHHHHHAEVAASTASNTPAGTINTSASANAAMMNPQGSASLVTAPA